MIWLTMATLFAMALAWAMCKVAGEYDDMIEDCFMPTDMIARARAQAVVDEWHGGGCD